MRIFVHYSPWIPMLVLVTLLGCSRSSEESAAHEAAAARSPVAVDASKARLPLQTVRIPFIENKGQSDPAVSHYTPTLSGTIFVTREGELVISLPSGEPASNKRVVLRERLLNAHAPALQGLEPTPTRVSSYIGADPNRWATDLPTFGALSLGEIYQGVSLQLRAFGKGVEKVFTVLPGADPRRIETSVSGGEALTVSDDGELRIETKAGAIAYSAPKAYQEIDGKRRHVDVAYRVAGKRYGFAVGDYDHNHVLVIDPLVRTTFIGGSQGDYGFSVAIAPSGDGVYVAGYAYSSDFPTTEGSAQEDSAGDQDLFVALFNTSLSKLSAATYFGGTSREYGGAIAVHPESGKIYLAGMTWSKSLPNTTGFQTSHGGGNQDAFVTMLNADLSGPPVTSFLGGSADDVGIAIAIHDVPELGSYGDVYVGGRTASTDFPQTTGGFQETRGGVADPQGIWTDVFVSRISEDLLIHYRSTYLGGTLADELSVDTQGSALAVHPVTGDIHLAGFTQSNTMPGFLGQLVGQFDAFHARLNPKLTELVTGIYITGNDQDMASALTILPSEEPSDPEVFIIGRTKSVDFLMSPDLGGYQDTYPGGNFSAFVVGLSQTGTNDVLVSTYLGGGGDDRGYGIAADLLSNEIWVTGETTANTLNPQNDFPLTDDADQATYAGAGDAFVSRLSRDLLTLSYSTYLGGSARDYGVSLSVDSTNGNMFVVGSTSSAELAGTDQYSFDSEGAGGDAFVAAFASELPGPPVTWELETVGPGEVAWDLAVDEDGDLHACYFEGNELKYAKRDADTEEWTIVTRAELNPSPDPDGDVQCPTPEAADAWSDCSIAVAQGGAPHICFTTVPKSYVDVLRRSHVCYVGPGAGDPEQVSSDAQSITGNPLNVTGECAIEIDPDQRPTIAYSEYEYRERPLVFRLNIAVKLQPDTAWLDMPEINTPVGSVDSGLYPGLAFNQDGIPLVTFQTAKYEARIFVPSFYPPANNGVRPQWFAAKIGNARNLRLALAGRVRDLDRFYTSGSDDNDMLFSGGLSFAFSAGAGGSGGAGGSAEPRDANTLNISPNRILLEYSSSISDRAGLRFTGLQYLDAGWVNHNSVDPTTGALAEDIPVQPSFLGGQSVSLDSYITERIGSGLGDCALAAGAPVGELYALCMRQDELTFATRFVPNEGVLAISPVRWKFGTGQWFNNPKTTGDWRAFYLSNIGDATIEVTDVTLETESKEDWELDERCHHGVPLRPIEPMSVTAVCIRYVRTAPGNSEATLVVESTGGTVESTLIGGRVADADDDGVADEEEWGPDGTDEEFDGNDDGTPDGEQAHVASLHSADGEGYVTIAISEGGGALEEVTPHEEPKDSEWEWPWGFYGFRVTGFTGPVVVEIFLHEGRTDAPVSYYVKYGRQDRVGEPTYYVFEYEESAGTGADLKGDPIRLHLIDGQLGDDDWAENDVIVDPGGPAVESTTDSNGGCSCRIGDRSSVVSNLGLGLLVLGLLATRRRRRRR